MHLLNLIYSLTNPYIENIKFLNELSLHFK